MVEILKRGVTNEEIVSEIIGKKTAGEKARLPLEKQWYQHVAFYLSKQWAQYNPASGELIIPKAPSWRERMVDNKIYPAIRKSLAKRTKNRPISYVEPSTNEQEDVEASRIGTKILTYFQQSDRLGIDTRDEELLLWGDLCGNGYYWLRWNPTLNATLAVPTGDGSWRKEEARVGDIEVESPTPFEIVADVFDRWVIRSQLLPIEYLEEVYPDMVGKIKPAEEKVAGSHFEKKLLTLIGGELGAVDYNKTGMSKVALHIEYYEILTKNNPKGRKIVIIGGQLATEPDQENIYGFLPYVRYSPEMLPGVKNYGTSCFPHLMAPQKSFNQTRSLIKENKKLMVRPKILIPEGAALKETQFTSEAGEKIVYAGKVPPSYLRPPEITTQGTEKDMDRDLSAIEDCTAQHEACVDDKTECLTKRGWLNCFQVTPADDILTFNLNNQKAEWNKVEVVNTFEIDKEILKIYNSDFEVFCTKQHKWIVKSSHDKWKLVQADDLSSDMFIPRKTEFNGEEKAEVDPVFASFLGWYITEGNITYNRSPIIRISQSEKVNSIKREEIRDLLKELKVDFRENLQKDECIHFTITNERDKVFIEKVLRYAPDKKLTMSLVLKLDRKGKENLLDAMIKGDGGYQVSSDSYHYSTIDEETANSFQALLSLLGKRGSLTKRKRLEYPNNKAFYDIDVNKIAFTTVAKLKREKSHYKGIVWCPTTENGTWLARRNGKVFYTGNSRGMVPPGVKSGVGLAYLVEQDDTTLAPTTRRFELAKSKLGKKMLMVVQKMYKEERMLKIVGTDKSIETLRFQGATIKDNTDVKVVPDSALPQSKTARRMQIMEYFKEGLFGDPRQITTRKKVLKLLEFGSVNEMFEEENIDIKVQENENEMMKGGTFVEVQPYDNHEVHLQVIDKFVKGDDFKMLPPEIQNMFLMHRGLHIQAAANYELPGGAGAPGGPQGMPGGGRPPVPEEAMPEDLPPVEGEM